MTQMQAVEIIRKTHPNAVIRKVWMPKRGKNWFKVISEPVSWQGGVGGQFAHVELSKPFPTPLQALESAALQLIGVTL